jgi:hypothetical protein
VVASAPTVNDAAAALLVAYESKHPGSVAPQNAIVLPLAQLMGEGSLSRYFAGTNNLGAMHATQSFAKIHAADAGFGMVAFLDHGPGGGAYVTRMSVYPSLSNGARALLDLVERMVDLSTVSDATDYARQLYAHGYYTGLAAPVTPLSARPAAIAAGTLTGGDLQNIASYAALLTANEPAALSAFRAMQTSYTGNPSAVTSGNFAPLADRLTPSAAYAPHTLEHARILLGDAATHPPAGGISLADALSAPGGDGVWLFGPGAPPSAPAGPPLPATSPASGSSLALAALVVVTGAGLVVAAFGGGSIVRQWRRGFA